MSLHLVVHFYFLNVFYNPKFYVVLLSTEDINAQVLNSPALCSCTCSQIQFSEAIYVW